MQTSVRRIKICERCGRSFGCDAGGCWCSSVELSAATLEQLQRMFSDCLCPDCLTAIAQAGTAESERAIVTSQSSAGSVTADRSCLPVCRQGESLPDLSERGPIMKPRLVMSWSGGKDCAMALYELTRSNEFEVVALLTTVSEEYRRVSHHGVREALLDAQAEAIGLPLAKVYLPSNNSHPCTDAMYEELMGQVLGRFKADGVATVGFGDLFLADLRAWRETNLARMELRGVFPLWHRDTTELAHEIIRLGFKSHLSCVEGKVGPGFVGRLFDESFLRDLPVGVDPCGENGEFHSFVSDGPIFQHPVAVEVGQIVCRDGRFYADLLPASVPAGQPCTAAEIPPVR